MFFPGRSASRVCIGLGWAGFICTWSGEIVMGYGATRDGVGGTNRDKPGWCVQRDELISLRDRFDPMLGGYFPPNDLHSSVLF